MSVHDSNHPDPHTVDIRTGPASSADRFLWWRLLGVLTVIMAIIGGVAVRKIEHHLSRTELARVFAMAMTPVRPPTRQVYMPPPSTPAPPRPVRPIPSRPVVLPPVVTRPQPIVSPSAPGAPPFSVNPSEWVRPETTELAPEPPRVPPFGRTSPTSLKSPQAPPAPPPPVVVHKPQPEVPARIESPASESSVPPSVLAAQSLQQTQVSEVTRQVWIVLCLVILECVALAGLSAVLNMARSHRNLLTAAFLLFLGTAITIAGVLVLVQWGGYRPPTREDYIKIVFCGSAYGVVLILALVLPPSLEHARRLRRKLHEQRGLAWFARPLGCGLLYATIGMTCAVAAWAGNYLSLPLWHLIRWVPIAWGGVAILMGLGICIGQAWLMIEAYVVCLLGILLNVAAWGVPFAMTGPPQVLAILPAIVALQLIALGRIRSFLDSREMV